MLIKEITLKASLPDQIFTETMYEIATARSERAELVRINLQAEAGKKPFDALVRILKKMKAEGRIQFFATKDSFSLLSTEAVFLLNKYPEHITMSVNLENNFIYIKL